MKSNRILAPLASLVLGAAAFAGELDKKAVAPPVTPLDDKWRFSLSIPGWMAGLDGDIGINGVTTAIGLDPADLLRRIDMAVLVRGEASKGRVGIMGDFVYLSLSDGIGTDTMVKKVDLQVDQIIGELALRWRLIDDPGGSLDVYAGLRYTNIFQQVVTQPNSQRIGEVSDALVDAVSERLRTALSESGLRELVEDRLRDEISGRVPTFGPGPPTHLPIGPLGGRLGDLIRERVAEIIEAKRAELAAAVRAAQQAAGAARVRAQARLDELKKEIRDRIATFLESKLDARLARTDDWWDPFIGLRVRLNLSNAWYLTAKGDIGGFGVGSDFTWHAEAALGCQITRHIYAEAGYRALGVDYDHDGLIYDVITHGAQITVGINF